MRVGDGDGGGAHFVFAYYVTGHGSGHATRALEVRPSLPLDSSTRLRLTAWCGGARA